MLLDRKMLINNLIQQSGISHSESVVTDEHHTLKIIASLLLDFVPAVGNAKMASEAIRGVDLVTGEPLVWWQRTLCAFGAAAPFLVKGLKAAADGGKLVVEGVSELAQGAKAAAAINEINKGAKVAETVSEAVKAEKSAEAATKVLSRSEMIQEVEKIIMPDGKLIGSLKKGNEHVIKEIYESPEKGKELFYKLVESCGAKDKIVPHAKPDVAAVGGLMAEIEKGFTIGWRPFSSSGPASVDINIKELRPVIEKFKFVGSK